MVVRFIVLAVLMLLIVALLRIALPLLVVLVIFGSSILL